MGQLSDWERYEIVLDFEDVRTVYVWGPPGIGKTYGAFHFGRVKRGFYAVTLTIDTSAAELRGHFLFKGGDALWHDGPFVRAMREGKRLVINEIGNAGADVLALLFPILESWETAELTLPTGETVRPAPGFHVVATDNRPPDQLPEALQDRFMAYIRVLKPHPNALAEIDERLLGAVERSFELEDERRPSARSWKNLSTFLPVFGLEESCRMVFGPDRGAMLHDALFMAEAAKGTKKRKKA